MQEDSSTGLFNLPRGRVDNNEIQWDEDVIRVLCIHRNAQSHVRSRRLLAITGGGRSSDSEIANFVDELD